jgi:hypothetical protein
MVVIVVFLSLGGIADTHSISSGLWFATSEQIDCAIIFPE